MKRHLLMGCGNDHTKRVGLTEDDFEWDGELIKVDMNDQCGADIVLDLEDRPLPFPDEHFDSLSAFDVLEHLGRQGDWKGYFEEFAEWWRLLKPGGLFYIMVPVGADAFADPGHTRFFSYNHFNMLSKSWYAEQLAKGIRVTDYRWFWKRNFRVRALQSVSDPKVGDHHLVAVLEKV